MAKCSDNLYGYDFQCINPCPNTHQASDETNLCVTTCPDGTFLESGTCESSCSSNYADPATHECSPTCTNGLFGDSTTNTCVSVCPIGYYRDSTGYCLNDCSVNNRKKDNITGNC